MRTTFLVVMVSLFGCATFFAGDNYQPLSVKTGLWEVTEHTVAKGLPPALAGMANHTNTYKTCVTPENLKENPFSNEKCSWTLLNSSSSDMEAKGTACRSGNDQDSSADVHYKLHAVDSEHVNGSGDWDATIQGQPMSGTITGSGHWLSASCGKVQ